ncbi:MAG: tetratricopeptide repeat protein [Gammaproteobacteria bacterium]|nr:tetratricopeptide repeat protein [Gammaproteobacteria bacterium]
MIARLLCFLLLCVTTLASADEDLVTRARALIDQGQAAAAYELLKPLEPQRAGEAEFDYTFGLAALDSGHTMDAMFALERVVDLHPEHGPARAELARTYLALGETDDARQEFDKVQQMDDLPPEARQTIERYMSNIDLFHDRTRTRYRPWFEVGLGYDTNVNGATSDKSVIVPAISLTQPATLSGTANSPLWNIGAGLRFTTPLDVERGLSLIGRIGLNHRLTVDEADFKTLAGNGQLGIHLRRDKHQFSLTGEADVAKIDGTSIFNGNRESAGVTTQYQYALDDNDQLSSFAQFQIVRYPEQRVRDVNRVTLGAGWGHAFTESRRTPIVFGSLFGGFEDPQRLRGGHFGRNFYGGRLGASVRLAEKHTVLGSFTYQQSDYHDPVPGFLVKRDEEFVEATIGYRYQHDDHWSVNPVLRYNDNSSNVVINDYDRFEFVVTLRNDF